MTNQPAAPAPGPAPEPQHAYYERMFNAAVVALAEISEALGITDEEALAANGNDLILERINELKQALRYMGCNCPGENKPDKNLHAPNCPYRITAMVDAAMVEMGNIHPPLRRSECERLIRAAYGVALPVTPWPPGWDGRDKAAFQRALGASQGATMTEFKNYRKKNVQPMRPYVPGEDMTGVSVNKEDTPEEGGMIAVNPANPEDKWYVAKQFFADNYVEA